MANPPDWAYQWRRDKALICKELVERRGDLTICLKTKDDPWFLERWIKHHAHIVGLRNLVIFDNMSTSEAVWSIYTKYRHDLLLVQFDGYGNLVHHVALYRELYEALKQATAFFSILDTDEALVLVEKDRFHADASIVEFIQSCGDVNWFPGTWLHNTVGSESLFHCGRDMSVLIRDLHGGKPIIRAKAVVDGEIYHNLHVYPTVVPKRTHTNLFVLHRPHLWPEQRIATYRNWLMAECKACSEDAVRNFVSEGDDLQTILAKETNHLPQRVRKRVTELWRMVKMRDRGVSALDRLEPGLVRFGSEGNIEYFSDTEKELFRCFFEDADAILRKAFEPETGGKVTDGAKTISTKPDPVGPWWIKADPNPVPAGPGSGNTTIHWSTGDGSWGEVYLLVAGQPEKLYSAGATGSQTAAWINKGAKYEFLLYAGKEHEKVLARVVVTRD